MAQISQFYNKCRELVESGTREFIAKNRSQATPHLESDEVYERRVRSQLQQNYEQMQEPFDNGYRLLRDTLKDFHTKDPQNYPKSSGEDFNKFSTVYEILDQDLQKQAMIIEEDKALTEVLNISEDSQKTFNKIVEHFINENRFDDAKDVQAFLLAINPNKVESWLNLGFCQYNLGRYEEAIESYYVVTQKDEDDIRAYYFIAVCYLQLGQTDQANEIADELLKVLHREDPSSIWIERIENLKRLP